MKTSLYILLIIVSGLFTSCDKDDEPQDEQPQQEATISGTWNLTDLHGGFAGVNEQYEPGVITWTFNEETAVLTVVNNHQGKATVYDGYETGTYPYSTSTIEGKSVVSIDGGEFGFYTLDENEMTIDQGLGTDGYIFTFKR